MSKQLIFSITPRDCRLDTFTVGGNGGSGKDTSNTGVRWTHQPSGAVGEAREERSQLANKRLAWKRMGNDPLMKVWIHKKIYELSKKETIEEALARLMNKNNLKIEVRNVDGKWIEVENV